jgi:hypothetical protein
MKTLPKLAFALAALAVLGAAQNSALAGDDVKIGGSVVNSTTAKDVHNSAQGGAEAIQAIGTVTGRSGSKGFFSKERRALYVGGSLSNYTYVDNATNRAKGRNSTACQMIGAVGDQPCN